MRYQIGGTETGPVGRLSLWGQTDHPRHPFPGLFRTWTPLGIHGTSYLPLPGTGELQQLPSQTWAGLDCPSQCFILIAVGGMGTGSALKEIPVSYLNLAKLS